MERFTLKLKSKYKNLKVGDIIHIKGQKGNNTVITINTGRKEYLIPTNYVEFLKLISNNEITRDTVFINPNSSDCIGMYGLKNHVSNMTQLGKQVYSSHEDAEDFIRELSWQ